MFEVLFVLLLLLILLALGVPVAYSLIISSTTGLFAIIGVSRSMGILLNEPYATAGSYLYATIPMFVLMALFLQKCGLITHVFQAMYKWTSRLPGGLAITTTFANGGMAALTGSSTASAATMASIAIPEMRKYDYDDRLSFGTVAAAGTFAIMFPPSLGLILYGILTETSIADLFIAGIIPGILTLLSYVLLILYWSKRDPTVTGLGTDEQLPIFTWGEKFQSLLPIYPALLLILLVLGGLYGGVVTPSEAGALGASGAFLIAVIFYRIGFDHLREAIVETIEITVMIFMIIIGAMIFARFLALSGVTSAMITFVGDIPVNRWIIFLLIILFYIALGTIMSQTAILVLTIPVTFPLVVDGLGFHAIWFGIVLVKTAEIGMVTPPLGLNIYVAASAIEVELEQAFRGAARFVIADIIVLLLLLLFPGIVFLLL